jgi:hypothetical protein
MAKVLNGITTYKGVKAKMKREKYRHGQVSKKRKMVHG